jgi:hypothetical protein
VETRLETDELTEFLLIFRRLGTLSMAILAIGKQQEKRGTSRVFIWDSVGAAYNNFFYSAFSTKLSTFASSGYANTATKRGMRNAMQNANTKAVSAEGAAIEFTIPERTIKQFRVAQAQPSRFYRS